jgi:ADP-heptose:LPS heptosyltransferase
VVVARNDRLGDFILALPCFQLLKRRFPAAELTAYVPEYTREIAGMCPAIDRIVIDPKLEKKQTISRVSREWRNNRFDALLALRSTWDVSVPGFLARIPVRVGPLTNFYSALFTNGLRQKRSRSVKPEWSYNLDLANHLLHLYGIEGQTQIERPVIHLNADRVSERRQMLRERYGVGLERPLVFVHPGQSGTSNNLSAEQYADLIRGLRSPRGLSLIITAGPGEMPLALKVSSLLGNIEHAVIESTEGLRAFAELLANADVFVASSTGPLHIAGALDRPSAGFYERRSTRGPLRWQTLNSPDRLLSFTPPPGADERDVQATNIDSAVSQINDRFLSTGMPLYLAAAQ